MNIAIFADVHGRILLAFKLCARWQRETGETLDLILQAGDMGIFPLYSQLDSATLRYAQQDPTELGFMQHFVSYTDEIAAVLAQTNCKLIFVRGNHEDHAWLDGHEQQASGAIFPVDAYQRLYCLKTGVPYTHAMGNEHISMLGIGRIGQRSAPLSSRHIQPEEQARLNEPGDIAVDVLLTHDKPAQADRGMTEISTALQQYHPLYHFYGHVGGECLTGLSDNGVTQFCKLADLHWDGPEQRLHPGSMAILRWQDSATHSLSIVRDPWYAEYNAHNWQYVP